LRVRLHHLVERYSGAEQQLLETVMKCAGQLSACVLLRQSQLRREPPQLECSLLQLRMTLFQLRVTPAECVLSLAMQGPLAFFIAACLENFLGAAAFCDVQIDPTHPGDLSVGGVVGAAQTVHPPYGSIRSHGTEYDVPLITMPVKHVVEVGKHFRAVLLVNTGDPCVEYPWSTLRKAVLRMESVVPVRLIGEGIPCPHARRRCVKSEPEPLFALPQCFLDQSALRDIQFKSGEPH